MFCLSAVSDADSSKAFGVVILWEVDTVVDLLIRHILIFEQQTAFCGLAIAGSDEFAADGSEVDLLHLRGRDSTVDIHVMGFANGFQIS